MNTKDTIEKIKEIAENWRGEESDEQSKNRAVLVLTAERTDDNVEVNGAMIGYKDLLCKMFEGLLGDSKSPLSIILHQAYKRDMKKKLFATLSDLIGDDDDDNDEEENNEEAEKHDESEGKEAEHE